MSKYSRIYNQEHYSRWSCVQKRHAVSLYLTGDYSKSSIARDFGVSVPGLDRWIEKFSEEILSFQTNGKPLISGKSMNQSDISMAQHENQKEEKDKEIARLRHELYLSQVKNDILDAMIDIAKDEYNIDLRKKAGPQQYKKPVNKKDTKS